MAACVVPQEYGTTIVEKRSVGVKICHGLLEKIKYDLNVARKDNEVDMRYLINLDYQSDMNINSMGRRIRTRLYFTSESHLHTVLSVLRFASDDDKASLLSEHGMSIVNSTPELCYLTQIVMRVFEDSRRSMDDPRRFRVEILFSPGANATPFHIHEQQRDQDSSRFDTAPLQLISREGLTCQDVEDFFEEAMMLGGNEEETPVEESVPINKEDASLKPISSTANTDTPVPKSEKEEKPKDGDPTEHKAEEPNCANGVEHPEKTIPIRQLTGIPEDDEEEGSHGGDPKLWISRKHYWSAVAIGSFVLGASCLLMALSLTADDPRARRRWTRKY